uniref:ANK_REP_REGION domain-containing protein n=1 Tax=Anopheles minimus TaxID=112268 RepID=A0A182VV91_9DIPT
MLDLMSHILRKPSAAQAQILDNLPEIMIQKNENDHLLLHQAAQLGNFVLVEHILERQPQQADEADRFGMTPLMLAAQNLHMIMVTNLKCYGASIETKDIVGYSPLANAIVHEND